MNLFLEIIVIGTSYGLCAATNRLHSEPVVYSSMQTFTFIGASCRRCLTRNNELDKIWNILGFSAHILDQSRRNMAWERD